MLTNPCWLGHQRASLLLCLPGSGLWLPRPDVHLGPLWLSLVLHHDRFMNETDGNYSTVQMSRLVYRQRHLIVHPLPTSAPDSPRPPATPCALIQSNKQHEKNTPCSSSSLQTQFTCNLCWLSGYTLRMLCIDFCDKTISEHFILGCHLPSTSEVAIAYYELSLSIGFPVHIQLHENVTSSLEHNLRLYHMHNFEGSGEFQKTQKRRELPPMSCAARAEHEYHP